MFISASLVEWSKWVVATVLQSERARQSGCDIVALIKSQPALVSLPFCCAAEVPETTETKLK